MSSSAVAVLPSTSKFQPSNPTQRLILCGVCGVGRTGHNRHRPDHEFIGVSFAEDAARKLIQESSLYSSYQYCERADAHGQYAVFRPVDGTLHYCAANWEEAAAKLFPSPSEVPSDWKLLYQNPNNPALFSETPFTKGQKSNAVILPPADAYAVKVTGELFHKNEQKLKNRNGVISITQEVLQAYVAASYNAGFAASIDAAYAEAFADQNEEMEPR